MSIKRRFLEFIINKYYSYLGHRAEIKKQREKKRVAIAKTVILSKKQKKQIDSFFKKNYGKRVGYQWHRAYTAISGTFDFKFFPEYFYSPDFQRLSNDPKYYKGLADKNIFPLIIKGSGLKVKIPHTLFFCSNGVLFDASYNIISLESMVETLMQIDSFFIKPSIDSDSGHGCELIKTSELTNKEIKNIILQTGSNYVIQERIINQDDIAVINPTSLNTFRVVTYFLDGKIYVSPIILRIGRNNSFCDNAHAGGLFVAVSDNGDIISDGITEYNERVVTHPNSGISLKGYHIKNVNKIIDSAQRIASLFPHVGVIDWDLTLDANEDVVVVEGNMFGGGGAWLIQMSHGKSIFGNNTERVLQLIKENKPLYNK